LRELGYDGSPSPGLGLEALTFNQPFMSYRVFQVLRQATSHESPPSVG
jgi:hypothetical protein